MKIFHEIINGNGYPQLKWIAVRFIGSYDSEELKAFTTYAEAVDFKLWHKHRFTIILELWYIDETTRKLVGDEQNFLQLKENLTFFIL